MSKGQADTPIQAYTEDIVEAVATYLRRQARLENPAGKFDRAGRFHLAEVCGRECSIRPPSRRYPYSQMLHGRTLVHCAHALGVSRTESMKLLREIRKKLQTEEERRQRWTLEQDALLADRLLESADDELAERLARSMGNGREPGQLRPIERAG